MNFIIPLGTKLSIGVVVGAQSLSGERYYFLTGGGVSYYPADVVEGYYKKEITNNKQ